MTLRLSDCPLEDATSDDKRTPGPDDKQEVQFLVENFDVPPIRAAELIVGEGQAADAVASEVMKAEHESDPLADMPVPDPEKDPEHLEPEIGDLEKPVVHKESAPT